MAIIDLNTVENNTGFRIEVAYKEKREGTNQCWDHCSSIWNKVKLGSLLHTRHTHTHTHQVEILRIKYKRVSVET